LPRPKARRIRLAFASLYTYSLFNPSTRYVFGGSEVRAWLLGTALSEQPEFDVSFVVFDHGQPRERYGRVTVYPHSFYRGERSRNGSPPMPYQTRAERYWGEIPSIARRVSGFPGVELLDRSPAALWKLAYGLGYARTAKALSAARRLVYPPLDAAGVAVERKRVATYRRVDADVYCVFGVSDFSAELAAFCRARGKRLVVFLASDLDVSRDYVRHSQQRNMYGSTGHSGWFTLSSADVIVAQTAVQARMLRERHGREAVVIGNPVELDRLAPPFQGRADGQRHALWIGKSDRIKQPDVLLELAERCPEVPFLAVLNRSNVALFDEIATRRPPNVELVEHVPIREVEALFAGAFAFINTSSFEGFPNTYLQAGKYGVPILSLGVDPDGFVRRYRCGVVTDGDVGALAVALRELRASPSLAAEYSANVRSYVRQFHDLHGRVADVRSVLCALCGTG
jgi:glycosyltransferase involved in cell wall biosynthesis